MNILDTIVANKRIEVEDLKQTVATSVWVHVRE